MRRPLSLFSRPDIIRPYCLLARDNYAEISPFSIRVSLGFLFCHIFRDFFREIP